MSRIKFWKLKSALLPYCARLAPLWSYPQCNRRAARTNPSRGRKQLAARIKLCQCFSTKLVGDLPSNAYKEPRARLRSPSACDNGRSRSSSGWQRHGQLRCALPGAWIWRRTSDPRRSLGEEMRFDSTETINSLVSMLNVFRWQCVQFTCFGSTTSTRGSTMATSLMQLMSKLYTSSQKWIFSSFVIFFRNYVFFKIMRTLYCASSIAVMNKSHLSGKMSPPFFKYVSRAKMTDGSMVS